MRSATFAAFLAPLLLAGCAREPVGPPVQVKHPAELWGRYDKAEPGRGPLDNHLVEVAMRGWHSGRDARGHYLGVDLMPGKSPGVVFYLRPGEEAKVPADSSAVFVVRGVCRGVRKDDRAPQGYYVEVGDCAVINP